MKHVIIGASAAGLSAAQTIRNLCPADEITVISRETDIYSRCMLPYLISGQHTMETISFVPPDFFATNRIRWLKGQTVKSLDTAQKQVSLASGDSVGYDTLLIATGSLPVTPPIPGLRTAKNAFPLRELADAAAVAGRARAGAAAVIIGGGLIGIDAAAGLAARGVRVSVTEMADRIMPQQLDKKSASKYEELCKQRGIDIYTGTAVQEVLLNAAGEATGVRLSDNRSINAALLVVAAGVCPNTGWINDPAIKINKGIITDDYCRTTAEAVFTAGDVTGKAGIWPLAVKQGITAAYNMSGQAKVLDDNFSLKNSLNFFDLPTVSLGIVEAPEDSYDVHICETPSAYKKITCKEGIVYGAIFQGDIAFSGAWTEIIGHRRNISHIAAKDIFDVDYSDFYKLTPAGQFSY